MELFEHLIAIDKDTLSLDVDFTRIKTKSRFLKSVFTCINIIKIPFPNLEVSEGKLKFNYY
jgi:hypothetical protein